ELRRLIEPALDRVLALQGAALRGDDADHNDLVALGQEAQRLEAAGAVGVVFQEGGASRCSSVIVESGLSPAPEQPIEHVVHVVVDESPGIHFLTLAPASSATAPSVVCAAFSPSRKSLSE